MKFTIRNLFPVTMIVALAVGWCLREWQLRAADILLFFRFSRPRPGKKFEKLCDDLLTVPTGTCTIGSSSVVAPWRGAATEIFDILVVDEELNHEIATRVLGVAKRKEFRNTSPPIFPRGGVAKFGTFRNTCKELAAGEERLGGGASSVGRDLRLET